VKLSREQGQPILVLDGRPQLAFADTGALTSDRIEVRLRELQDTGTTPTGLGVSLNGSGTKRIRVIPERLSATGRVELQSRQLSGRTNELVTEFHAQLDHQAAAGTGGWTSASESHGPIKNPLAGPIDGATEVKSSAQAYHIDAARIQIHAQLSGQSADPSSIVCDGDVLLREVPLTRTDEQPFEIRGNRLTVDQLNSGTAHVTLTGSRPDEAVSSQLVQLTGRGITMLAAMVELDQRENRLWTNGPGKATLLVTRDLPAFGGHAEANGREPTTPIPVEISWQAGLAFDGRTILLTRNVVVSSPDNMLRCDQLSARLTTPVQFGQRFDQRGLDLEEAECKGNVSMEHHSRDGVGVISHERLELARLTVNQRTGAISGDGPGEFRSTRFGNGLSTLGPAAKTPAAGGNVWPPPGAAGSKLYFLGLDFQQGLRGNLVTRELELFDRVRTVYGPVDSWEQELDVARPETLPPETVRLLCDELRVNEDPIAARAGAAQDSDSRPLGYIQLQATSNVRIDGQSAERGAFVAQAGRASYEQAKDVFLLEGDPRTPATIWYAGQSGPPPAFRKITFNRSTGELKGDFMYLEFTPGDVENARRPGTVRQ
jgi:hypothetical protein